MFVSAVALLIFAWAGAKRLGAHAFWLSAASVALVGVSRGLPLLLALLEL